jgi:hypothetical protein
MSQLKKFCKLLQYFVTDDDVTLVASNYIQKERPNFKEKS